MADVAYAIDFGMSDDDYAIDFGMSDDDDPMGGLPENPTDIDGDGKPDDENNATLTMDIDPSKVKVEASYLNTREGRAMSRVKLAQKGLQFSEMLGKAHPEGSKSVPGLDIKPTAAMSKFHVLTDVHDAMMNLANLPPRVRKQAEQIAKFVEAGEVDAADIDGLAAFGVDQDAIKYYKQYWGQAKDSESTDFANKLTQEHAAQKKAEDARAYQLRVKQAYDLAYNMHSVGMIEKSQIEDQVNEALGWNDAGFESVSRMVSRQQSSVVKRASIPEIGMMHSDQIYLPSAQSAGSSVGDNDVKNFFDAMFAGKKL
jgi:hypothetical protein